MKNFDYWNYLHKSEKLEEFNYDKIELTYLKKQAIETNIEFDKNAKPSDIYYEIIEKMKDRNDSLTKQVINTLKTDNLEILNDAQSNPKKLAKWLYENQGEMRFGAENRIFIVLVDTENFSNSWKLKRNIDLLEPAIISYIDNFMTKHISDLQITFEYKGRQEKFSTLTDIIFIIK